ncbi:phosphotransferase family protein [Deinococcus yunweiensis]|uniref:phosphotransferase family protein n=1 Tax=Deinococcus yunweiensis TaxID=367282 RepID=UPI00398F86CB
MTAVPVRRETTLHLLFTQGDRSALQTLSTDQMTYFGANVREAAHAAGWPGTLLRRLHFQSHGEVDGVRRADVVWHVHPEDGATLDWRPDKTWSDVQRAWITVARTPPSNVPWMHPGWHADALDWLEGELAAQGLNRSGEPAVLKHWQISLLWRVPTDAGAVYFKAVPAFFAREIEVTPLLAQELEGAAPPVLAADTARGFLLLEDAGDEVSHAPDLNAVMTHVAGLQRSSVPHLPGWTLRDRGPEYVLSWLEHLHSDDVLLPGRDGGLSDDEAATLRRARPQLEAALRRLATSPIPRTLGHGDLHGGNLLTQDGRLTLLDWSDVCVTHPFLDVNPAYFFPYEQVSGDWSQHGAVLDAARDTYLEAWMDCAPLDDLRSLFTDALVCGELFRALGYVDGIQGAVEDKTEWAGAHLDHLRRVLTLLSRSL